jgi:hypothetical protein
VRGAGVALAAAIVVADFSMPAAQPIKQHIVVDHLSVDFTVKTPSITAIDWFTARLTIRNHGRRPVRLDTRTLDYATLTLEFRGPDGMPVPHCPPPMPSADPPLDDIDPGRRIAWDYRAEICIRLQRGRYQVRVVYSNEDASDGAWVGGFQSDWVSFDLR